eukprot:g2959.t1
MSDIDMLDVSRTSPLNEKLSDLSVIHDDLLMAYYDYLFPVEELIKWLSYGNDSNHPEANDKYLQHREFCFTLRGDIFVRYQSFNDAKNLRRALIKKCPSKIDIGPVYNIDPQQRETHARTGFCCEERELVFDIDVSDYDDVRTTCNTGSMCNKDWPFMAAAIIILDVGLREDFGFEHLLWVYSGRRGIHCWVCDKRARVLSDKVRTGIANYFTVYEGQERGQAKINVRISSYPAIQRALQVCKEVWINRILPEQKLFESEKHAENIFKRIQNQKLIELAKNAIPMGEEDINQSIWRVLEKEAQKKVRSSQFLIGSTLYQMSKPHGVKIQWELPQALNDVVFAHVYPRLDMEVSKKMNHLLKAPFCVHPKTGRICVPIDPEKLWDFCPEDVPTVDKIVKQLNSKNNPNEDFDLDSTDLFPYVQYFREFTNSMHASNHADLTSKAKARSKDDKFDW